MSDSHSVIAAVRSSHDRFATLVAPLSDEQVRAQSYDSEWTIADVASHLGSGAEIFGMFLESGLTGADSPSDFGPVWDRWNALAPTDQVAQSVQANEKFATQLEQIPDDVAASFALAMFGMELDLAGLAGMRLGEHAVHTWDVAVALDQAAVVAADAVAILIDSLAPLAPRVGKPVEGAAPIVVATTDPQRTMRVELSPAVAITTGSEDPPDLVLPAEAFVRLVYGRLDPEHTPALDSGVGHLSSLRTVFPGF